MPIKVLCDCGRKLTLRDEAAGKRIRCPECKTPIAVPAMAEDVDGFPLMATAPAFAAGANGSNAAMAPAPHFPPIQIRDDEEDDAPPVPGPSAKMPREPWYYRFLATYAKVWLWLGLIQFGLVLAITAYRLLILTAEGVLSGPFLGSILWGLAIPLGISLCFLFALCLIAAPILLAVDAARNLRAILWLK